MSSVFIPALTLAAASFWIAHDVGISLSGEGLIVDGALRLMQGQMPGRDLPES